MIQLTTLGTVDLRSSDGEEYRSVLVQRKRLALLTYLVVARPRGFHRRDSLLPVFWPEMTETRARHALRQSLHFLRQSLGPGAIETRGGEEVGVVADRCECDAVLFEEYVAADRWEEAVALYNGPMLKGVHVSQSPDFDRWLDAERRRLGDLYVKALDGLLEAKDVSPVRSVQWLRRRAEHDPYDADATLRLMRALEAVNDRPGALHQARAYLDLVTDELGVDPDTRVTKLADRLTSRAPTNASKRVSDSKQAVAAAASESPKGRWSPVRLVGWSVATAVLTAAAFGAIAGLARSRDAIPAALDGNELANTTLIVTPFRSLSDSTARYLAEGIAEGVLNRLAGISSLRVIGWVKDESSAIPSPLGESPMFPDALVLRASVQRDQMGTDSIMIRVVASVTRAKDGEVVWRQTVDRGFADIAQVERDIATSVVDALRIPTLVAEREWLQTLATSSPEAYDEYLLGMSALDRNGWIGREWTAFGPRVDFPRAVQHFETATQFDSSFVQPVARLSIANTSMYHWRHDRTAARLERAKDAMDRAVQLRPDLQATHLAAAWYYFLGQLNYNRALRHLRMATSDWAGKAEAMLLTGAIARRQGEVSEAIDQYHNAELEAGICPDCRAELAYSYYVLGEVEQATDAIKTASDLAPQLHLPRHVMALIQLTEFDDFRAAEAAMHPLATGTDDVMHLAASRWGALVRVLGGKWEQALDELTLDQVRGDTTGFFLAKAELADRRRKPEQAIAYYDSARVSIENVLTEVQDNPFARSELGLAYAGLGRRADAIREGTAAVRLRPISSDVLDGPLFVEALAMIYMKLGEFDAAVRQLEETVEYPGWLSPALIRIDPRWAPLRGHPGFQRLIAATRPT